MAAELDANFKQYELVVVDDACTETRSNSCAPGAGSRTPPLTILHMSIYHGLEDAQ